jgi:hypothetical protein
LRPGIVEDVTRSFRRDPELAAISRASPAARALLTQPGGPVKESIMRNNIVAALAISFTSFAACGPEELSGGPEAEVPILEEAAPARSGLSAPPVSQYLKESVTCVFASGGAIPTEQRCASNKGSCIGIGSCTVRVSGARGEKVSWNSSCGGHATTVIDGRDERAVFDCSNPPPPGETVTCVFAFNGVIPTEQACHSTRGSCKGVGSCSIAVSGSYGEKLTWSSSCGKTATTVIDWQDEKAVFDCSVPPTTLTEEVVCIFTANGSIPLEQECYSSKGKCRGIGRCSTLVTGLPGEKLEWKSSCGGYASTVIDAVPEQAAFSCQ